jgi:hypothetical protein
VFRSIKSNYSKNEISIIKIKYNTTVYYKKHMNHKKLDIMDDILEGHGSDFAAPVEELNCLIYKNDSVTKDEIPENHGEKTWQASKDNVSVQVWDGKAKIKVKVSQGKKTISMKQIAKIAVNAIVEELKKED